jgi:hypothetical protein
MDISRQDNSNQAEISRLKTIVAALSDKLAAFLPPSEEMASDAADFDAEVARQAKVEKIGQLFRERTELLKRIDEAIDQLGEFVRAETMLRRDIAAQGLLSGIDKDRRNSFLGDVTTNNLILARLGEFGIGKDRRHDRNEVIPKLASLVETQNFILKQVQGA